MASGFRLFRKIIANIVLILLIAGFIYSVYHYKNWYKRQYHKCVGFYYVNKGDTAFRERKYQKAIDYYKAGLREYPGHADAGCNLGNIYVSFENFTQAAASYKNALKYDPKDIACRMDLGIILAERMAEYDNAINEYKIITDSKPFTVNIPFVFSNKKENEQNKGLAYYNMGLAFRGKAVYVGHKSTRYKEYLKAAADSYKNAQKYLKNDYDNTYNLALTNHLLGNYTAAAKEYCDAININPEIYDAHYNFAMLLKSMKRNKEALSEFEKTTMLLDPDSNTEKIRYLFGVTLELQRDILNEEGGYEYLKNRVNLTSLPDNEISYTNGKVSISKQKKYNMNNLLKCTYGKEFKEL